MEILIHYEGGRKIRERLHAVPGENRRMGEDAARVEGSRLENPIRLEWKYWNLSKKFFETY